MRNRHPEYKLPLTCPQGPCGLEEILVHILDADMDATVTANQEPRAMINTAPLNREAATTMIMGIQVAVGIGPRNLITGLIQYRAPSQNNHR